MVESFEIEYTKDHMVITHPAGTVTKYTIDDLNRIKLQAIDDLESANDALIDINSQIINLQLAGG